MSLPTWCKRTGDRRWKFQVVEPVFAVLPAIEHAQLIYATQDGTHLGTLERSGVLKVLPGYAFDGATCAPDLPSLMRAIVVHDILCQCACNRPDWVYSRPEIDEFFWALGMEDGAAAAATTYYLGIAAFGWLHAAVFRPRKHDTVYIIESL